jgi:hypothetical protein
VTVAAACSLMNARESPGAVGGVTADGDILLYAEGNQFAVICAGA